MKLFEVDENKQLIPVTAVLCRAEKTPVGTLSAVDDFRFKNISNDTDEISFKVYSKINGEPAPLYDELANFKLIFIPEWQKYYQIEVSETEQDGFSVKNITGIHLSEAELGNLMLYHLEINTEEDIAREDYDPLHPSVIFDGTANCLLNRVLADKAPHYSVGYVSPSIKNLVRSFSIDNESIHNFLSGTLAEEIGCVVEYDSVNNKINLYDTYRHCTDCGCRFDSAASACPECGSFNVSDDYGNDTGILLSTDNLAEELQFDTDKDSLKTCFKISGGDELMNAAVRSVTPTAGDTIYCFSEEFYHDMPKDLSRKLKEYQTLCNSKKETYCTLSEKIYDCMDKIALYETSMMPSAGDDTDAASELAKLTSAGIGNVGINFTLTADTSKTLLDNAVLGVARLLISSAYKVEILSSSCTYNSGTKQTVWSGRFGIRHASNPEDTAEQSLSNVVMVTICSDYATFLEQKLNKSLFSDSAYKIDTNWSKYALSFLKTYASAYQSCLDILEAQKKTKELNNSGLCDSLSKQYRNLLDNVNAAIRERENQISFLTKQLSDYEQSRLAIVEELDLKTFLGETLWRKFCSYRRDGEYSNSNYISDGLSYKELLNRAKELVSAASSELYRASRTTCTISGTISNFLLMPEFKQFHNECVIGNWLYIQQSDNGSVYRLRLNGISGSYSSPEHIELTFSNAFRLNTVINKLSDTIQKASSIANSFSYVAHQASQGEAAKQNMEQWVSDGLNSALVRIKNNENEEVIFDEHGILAREYDDIQDAYSPEQLKITHNILAFTNDNWKTSTLALGNHEYKKFKDNHFVTESGYGLTSQFVTSAQINGSQIVGGQIYSDNYKPKEAGSNGEGTFIDLEKGSFSFAGGNLTYDSDSNILNLKGAITATSLNLDNCKIDAANISNLPSPDLTAYIKIGGTIGNTADENSTGFTVSSEGLLEAHNAIIYGSVYASAGTIAGWKLTDTNLYDANSSVSAGISKYGSGPAFWAGSSFDNKNYAPFHIGHDGHLYCSKISIASNESNNYEFIKMVSPDGFSTYTPSQIKMEGQNNTNTLEYTGFSHTYTENSITKKVQLSSGSLTFQYNNEQRTSSIVARDDGYVVYTAPTGHEFFGNIVSWNNLVVDLTGFSDPYGRPLTLVSVSDAILQLIQNKMIIAKTILE